MDKIKFVCAMLVQVALLIACSSDENEILSKGDEPVFLRISTEIVTKSADVKSDFKEEDKISVYASGKRVDATLKNGQWSMSDRIELNEDVIDVVAFYPHRDVDFSAIPINANDQIDYLFGSSKSSKSASTAYLKMNHALSVVSFNMIGGGSFDKVSFRAPLNATINALDGNISIDNEGEYSKDIIDESGTQQYIYEEFKSENLPSLFLIPTYIEKMTFTVNDQQFETDVNYTFKQGIRYILRLQYNGISVELLNIEEVKINQEQDDVSLLRVDTVLLQVDSFDLKQYGYKGFTKLGDYMDRPLIEIYRSDYFHDYGILKNNRFERIPELSYPTKSDPVIVENDAIYYLGKDLLLRKYCEEGITIVSDLSSFSNRIELYRSTYKFVHADDNIYLIDWDAIYKVERMGMKKLIDLNYIQKGVSFIVAAYDEKTKSIWISYTSGRRENKNSFYIKYDILSNNLTEYLYNGDYLYGYLDKIHVMKSHVIVECTYVESIDTDQIFPIYWSYSNNAILNPDGSLIIAKYPEMSWLRNTILEVDKDEDTLYRLSGSSDDYFVYTKVVADRVVRRYKVCMSPAQCPSTNYFAVVGPDEFVTEDGGMLYYMHK